MVRRKLVVTLLTGLSALAIAPLAFCANIVGTVSDAQGSPVQGVQIRVQNSAGKILANAQPDKDGHYQITGLDPGTYDYVLAPLGSAIKGGRVSSDLSAQGLTIDWKVSSANPAVALASEGAVLAGDPFGLSTAEFTALVLGGAGVVAGGVIGGYAAAGGFSSSSSAEFVGPIVSPAL
jgi:hypothetical protein